MRKIKYNGVTMYVNGRGIITKMGTTEPKRGTNMEKPIPHDVTLEDAYTESRVILTELVLDIRLAILEGIHMMNEQGEAEVVLGVENLRRKLIRAETFLGKQLGA